MVGTLDVFVLNFFFHSRNTSLLNLQFLNSISPQEEGGGSSSESRWIKSMGGLSVLLTPLALITFTCYFSGFICVLVMSANVRTQI